MSRSACMDSHGEDARRDPPSARCLSDDGMLHLRRASKWRCAAFVLAALCNATMPAAAAEPEALPRLYTNQSFAEDATRATTLAIDDPMAVFAFVLGNLPDRVKVYPTENYYYFYFVHRRIRYAGNIRFDVTDRDQGKVHFAYYEDLTEWTYYDEAIKHVVLDSEKSVTVEKL